MAQIAVESASLSKLEESLSYTAERLVAVWPSSFKSIADARPLARNPEALANKVYGGRMVNDLPGDGWKFRGQGLKQLTGKSNYLAYVSRFKIAMIFLETPFHRRAATQIPPPSAL